MKIEVKKDRKEIAEIIKRNINLLRANPNLSQEIADCILLYFIEKEEQRE